MEGITPNLAARRVLMSAYLYYELASPVLSDAEYDDLARLVSDRWDDLTPMLQWQLGSKEAIRSSGHQVHLTQMTCGGAREWHKSVRGYYPKADHLEWKHGGFDGCMYATIQG